MKLQGFIVLLILFFVYRLWFSFSGTLSSGDWPYLFLENIKEFSIIPQFGALWIRPYYEITAKIAVEYLGIEWHLAERIFWFWPFLAVIIFSSYVLFRSWISVLIYATNTYVLMIIGGGQLGVAMSYAMAPLVIHAATQLKRFILSNNIQSFGAVKNILFFCLLFSAQVLFDPRIAYLTFIFLIIFSLFYYKNILNKFKQFLFVFVVFGVIVFLINSFWMIPLISGKEAFDSIAKGYDSLSGFKFLSVADFSHSISLLHPNWPENLFGKTYFLQSEFLLLPILAFASLVFVKNSSMSGNKIKVLFYCLIGLLGAFLAKGSNPPFGFINEWLFQYFPGMTIFRDATKFYLLVALSYSFLIPFVLKRISRKSATVKLVMVIIFIVVWGFFARNALLGELKGTFRVYEVPKEYSDLKSFIKDQNKAFKVLWIPERQRYGFNSNSNPSISATDILNTNDPIKQVKEIKLNENSELRMSLEKMNVKYVVVPNDSQGELFIRDRSYSQVLRNTVEKELDDVDWLGNKRIFGGITLYEVNR